ncbi:MAG TPA: 2-oxoacid:ferredoxin oxidoreductase subunit beta [Dissulfurispiraceae bacterium]|nr:2-oxoacid:ferredoxin oxidoreductase subunit beta [Dissulfurispiraceae bacterium]
MSLDENNDQKPAWCPGCGNFGILKAFKDAIDELGFKPYQFTIVSGIGQAGKFPHYLKCNTFNGLHGRTLPIATGLKLANSSQLVVAVAGDGDCYGEGGNHLLHAIRRNISVKLFVHDNLVYGLTKGQASPTSVEGFRSKNLPFGMLSESLNPMALAVAMDCSFVARSFSGDTEHLRQVIKASILHKGFSLVDILQPCVSFNKVNTYEWYEQRIYHLDEYYDPQNRLSAFEKALEFGDRIPVGIIYRNSRRTFEEGIPIIREQPLVRQIQSVNKIKLQQAVREFY